MLYRQSAGWRRSLPLIGERHDGLIAWLLRWPAPAVSGGVPMPDPEFRRQREAEVDAAIADSVASRAEGGTILMFTRAATSQLRDVLDNLTSLDLAEILDDARGR